MPGPIVISILTNNSQANAGLAQTATLTMKTGSAFRRMAVPAVAALTAIGVAAYSTIGAASDLNESVSKNEQVFGKQAKAIEAFAARADTALGQTEVAALDAAATFGLIGQKAGLSERESAKFSKRFTGLASDLASFNNTSPEEAIEAIGAAMRGESEPIRKYGVLLDDATLRARALKLGLVSTTKDALSPQNKALAASQEILAQTTKAQGDFARTSGGAANQSRIFTAQVTNLKAGVGQGLLPVFTEFVTFGNKEVVPLLADLADKYAPKVADALADLPALLSSLKSGDVGNGSQYGEIADNIAKVGPAVADLIDALPSFNDTLEVTSEVIAFAADHTDLLAKALPFLVAGYVAVQAAQVAANAAAVLAVPTKFAEIAVNRQLVASNRALMASRTELTGAVLTGTTADRAQATAAAATTSKFSALGGAARLLAGGAGLALVTAGAGQTDTAVGALETTLGGAAAGFAVGGPIGGAVGGLGGLFFTLAGRMGKSAEAGQKAYDEIAKIDPIEEAKASLDDLKSTIDQVTGAYTGATRAAALQRLEEAGLLEVAGKYGISTREVINAALGQKGAMAGLKPVFADLAGQIGSVEDKQRALVGTQDNYIEGQGKLKKEVQSQYNELEKQKKALQTNLAVLDQFPSELRGMAKETRATSAATADYTGKLKGLPKSVVTRITEEGIEPTRAAIADLTRMYGLTPKQVKTLIEASGADTSAKAVQNLIDKMNALHDRTVNVYVNTHRNGGGAGQKDNPLDPAASGRKTATDVLAGVAAGFSQGSAGVETALGRITDFITKSLDRTVKQVDQRYDKIAKNLRKRLDGKELKKALEQNEKARDRATAKAERASDKAHKAIMRDTRDLRASILANGKAQDTANQAYQDATALLGQMREQAASYSASIRDAVAASGSLSALGQGDGFGSVEELIANRTTAAARAEEFARIINELTAAGLNSADLQDLISQGVEGGMGTAKALLDGGPGVIAQMNTLSAQLQATGTVMGDSLADTLYGAGIKAQEGLVAGLKDNLDVLIRQGDALGRALIKAVKKALKINSPSGVFRDEIMGNAVRGLDAQPHLTYVRRQGDALASSLTNGFGTPALNAYLSAQGAASGPQSIAITLTAEQLDALSRGRQYQADIDVFRSTGGRALATP